MCHSQKDADIQTHILNNTKFSESPLHAQIIVFNFQQFSVGVACSTQTGTKINEQKNFLKH